MLAANAIPAGDTLQQGMGAPPPSNPRVAQRLSSSQPTSGVMHTPSLQPLGLWDNTRVLEWLGMNGFDDFIQDFASCRINGDHLQVCLPAASPSTGARLLQPCPLPRCRT